MLDNVLFSNNMEPVYRVLGQLNKGIMTYVTKVIMVDNHSTDDSKQVVKEYLVKDPGIPAVLVRNTHNHGLEDAHKVALKYVIMNDFKYTIYLRCNDSAIKDVLPVLREGIYLQNEDSIGLRKKVESRSSTLRMLGEQCFRIQHHIMLIPYVLILNLLERFDLKNLLSVRLFGLCIPQEFYLSGLFSCFCNQMRSVKLWEIWR